MYQLAIRLYGLVIHIAAWFQPKAKQWVSGRKSIFDKLAKAFKGNNKEIIWMHCASLGEFEQGRPIIEQFKEKYPAYKILLTFYSPSGYEIRKDYTLADYVFYLPLDTPANARRFISIVRPKMVCFVKYEFWYFYLTALKEKQIPYYLIAGVFRPNQLFFKPYGKWYLAAIKGFDKLFLIDQTSLAIAHQHGLKQAIVTGDPRIDRVAAIAKNAPAIPIIKAFRSQQKLFILGSAHEKDWQLFFEFLKAIQPKSYYKDWRFLIAPHEVTPDQLRKIEKAAPLPIINYTNWSSKKSSATPSLLVLDTIGQLSSAYQYGDLTYIGGGFDKGIHNILEPAAFGLPILFGPNYRKFEEAVELVKQGGAVVVTDVASLKEIFEKCLADKQRLAIGQVTKDYIKENVGATDLIVKKKIN